MYRWNRPLSVDPNDRAVIVGVVEWLCLDPGYVEIVCDRSSVRHSSPEEESDWNKEVRQVKSHYRTIIFIEMSSKLEF